MGLYSFHLYNQSAGPEFESSCYPCTQACHHCSFCRWVGGKASGERFVWLEWRLDWEFGLWWELELRGQILWGIVLQNSGRRLVLKVAPDGAKVVPSRSELPALPKEQGNVKANILRVLSPTIYKVNHLKSKLFQIYYYIYIIYQVIWYILQW